MPILPSSHTAFPYKVPRRYLLLAPLLASSLWLQGCDPNLFVPRQPPPDQNLIATFPTKLPERVAGILMFMPSTA